MKFNPESGPFIVAEMSGNHNGSLERALELVAAAHESGADAFKLQTFTPEQMAAPDAAVRDGRWNGWPLVDLYHATHVVRGWHLPIFERCRALGMIPFSTAFAPEDVQFLEREVEPEIYKVASFELVDHALLRAVAQTGKPVFLSTGMATLGEIYEAWTTLLENGAGPIVLLKCTSAYPADPRDANLATLPHMAGAFGCEVGISDHTPGVGTAVAAVALGARVVEKHLTLARADGGPDADYSMEPAEFGQLVDECRRAWQSVGQIGYGPTEDEQASLALRRSLHVVADMKQGDMLTLDNMRALRPANGLPPRFLLPMVGMRVNRTVKAGTALTWAMVG